jgi:HlyD family secretion protein
MKRAIPILILLLGLSAYVYFFRIRPAREVDPTVRGSGSIETTEVVISAKIPARVLSITVAEGDAVTAGQTLATLDCADLDVRVAQAEAQLAAARAARVQAQAGERQARAQTAPLGVQLDLATKERARAHNLFKSGGATQRTVDQAEAAYSNVAEQQRAAELAVKVAASAVEVAGAQVGLAEKTLALAQTSRAECTLVAPVDGVVVSRTREPGELVLPGASLLELGQLSKVYTWIYVPNEEVGRVRLGQKAALRADTYPDRVFDGVVARINDEAEFTPKSIQTKEDRTRLVYGVKVTIDNADRALMPGMPVEAELLGSAALAPAPPATSEPADALPEPAPRAP